MTQYDENYQPVITRDEHGDLLLTVPVRVMITDEVLTGSENRFVRALTLESQGVSRDLEDYLKAKFWDLRNEALGVST